MEACQSNWTILNNILTFIKLSTVNCQLLSNFVVNRKTTPSSGRRFISRKVRVPWPSSWCIGLAFQTWRKITLKCTHELLKVRNSSICRKPATTKLAEFLQLLQTALDTPPPNLHFRFCWLNLACINLNLARDCFAWCYKSIKTTHESSFSACETLEHRPMELLPAFLHLHFSPIALLGSFKVRDSSKLKLIFILSLSDHIWSRGPKTNQTQPPRSWQRFSTSGRLCS